MIYTDLTEKTMRIAFDARKNQLDKSDLPTDESLYKPAKNTGRECLLADF